MEALIPSNVGLGFFFAIGSEHLLAKLLQQPVLLGLINYNSLWSTVTTNNISGTTTMITYQPVEVRKNLIHEILPFFSFEHLNVIGAITFIGGVTAVACFLFQKSMR